MAAGCPRSRTSLARCAGPGRATPGRGPHLLVGDTKFTQLRYACSGSAVVLNRSFAVMALSDKVANYYREARWRAQRRTSAWNILLFPFCIGSGLVLWYALFQLVWMFHVHVYPDHQFNEFWQRGISTGNFALSLVMMFAPAPGAMVLGFMLGNLIVWLIPPARRTLDAEATGYPGTSFRDAMQDLTKVCLWTLPAGFCVAFLAAYSLSSLR